MTSQWFTPEVHILINLVQLVPRQNLELQLTEINSKNTKLVTNNVYIGIKIEFKVNGQLKQ